MATWPGRQLQATGRVRRWLMDRPGPWRGATLAALSIVAVAALVALVWLVVVLLHYEPGNGPLTIPPSS